MAAHDLILSTAAKILNSLGEMEDSAAGYSDIVLSATVIIALKLKCL